MTDKKYAMITDIAFLNSNSKNYEDFYKLYCDKLFEDEKKWDSYRLDNDIEGLRDNIKSRMKYYMSIQSLGVYNVIEQGPEKNLKDEDEIYLFSGFTEIGTVSTIGDLIAKHDYSLNPSIFPNSVHHISLCYYTILKKKPNYCGAITDGLLTNYSFINFIKNRILLDDDFVVVSGEEDASFFKYESENMLNIVPAFTAYRVIPNQKKGFIFGGCVDSMEEIYKLDAYKEADAVLADKELFSQLKNNNKKILCEYPIIKDNPCGIIFRLAIPFYFNIQGKSILLENINGKIYYFEIKL